MIQSIVIFEKELLITWESNKTSIINLSILRMRCPCAWCSGEKDVFGNVYSGNNNSLNHDAFLLVDYEKIGLYGLRFFWKDGHKDGIFTFDLLKNIASNE